MLMEMWKSLAPKSSYPLELIRSLGTKVRDEKDDSLRPTPELLQMRWLKKDPSRKTNKQ